jgi:hypothetical protein
MKIFFEEAKSAKKHSLPKCRRDEGHNLKAVANYSYYLQDK